MKKDGCQAAWIVLAWQAGFNTYFIVLQQKNQPIGKNNEYGNQIVH